MRNEVIGMCPICYNKLAAVKLQCGVCNTSIEGSFTLSEFAYLTNEQKHFVKMFLKHRGNIKDLEKELGISYPTVRAKLNTIVAALGMSAKGSYAVPDKKAILKKLKDGEITAAQAVQMLEGESAAGAAADTPQGNDE